MKPPCPTTPHKRLASLWDRVSKTPKSSHSKSYTVVETYHKRPPSCVSDPNYFDLFSGGKSFKPNPQLQSRLHTLGTTGIFSQATESIEVSQQLTLSR